jgi:DNA-binding transcriptional regulator YhcF (GntR family)
MVPLADELRLQVDRAAEVPLGTQLAWRLRSLIAERRLGPGDRLPSVRELAATAGVNVNTVRAVYQRLESDGLIRSEQGRGTFVAGLAPAATGRGERSARQELRRQIAALETELVRQAQAPPEITGVEPGAASTGGRLPTTDELRTIRDQLFERLRELDAERADVMHRLAELERSPAGAAEPERLAAGAGARDASRRSSMSLRDARVRWVGN